MAGGPPSDDDADAVLADLVLEACAGQITAPACLTGHGVTCVPYTVVFLSFSAFVSSNFNHSIVY